MPAAISPLNEKICLQALPKHWVIVVFWTFHNYLRTSWVLSHSWQLLLCDSWWEGGFDTLITAEEAVFFRVLQLLTQVSTGDRQLQEYRWLWFIALLEEMSWEQTMLAFKGTSRSPEALHTHIKVTRHLCCKNLPPLDILACNSASIPSFQNPKYGL